VQDGLDLTGVRAVVTGGAAGIGRATCERLAQLGASVAVLDIDGDGAKAVAAGLTGGDAAVAVEVDVLDTAALTRAIDEAAAAIGGITLLFNNAGFGTAKSIDKYTDDEFHRLVDGNLTSTWAGIRSAVPHLRAAGGGCIVNMAGTTATRATRGEAPYTAAKAGVIAMTRTAAVELAPDIRVNCVSPGYIDTNLTAALAQRPDLRETIESRIPLLRFGDAVEVANAVAFLASPLAAYITGVDLVIDGGCSLPSAQVDDILRRFIR
jgi:NAD(P)-dependent dehydrogenase (short-subunit alcohol dehydrogenase family)